MTDVPETIEWLYNQNKTVLVDRIDRLQRENAELRAKAEKYDSVVKALSVCDGGRYRNDTIESCILALSKRNEALRQLAERDAEVEERGVEVEKWKEAFAAQSRKLQSVLHITGVRAALSGSGDGGARPTSTPRFVYSSVTAVFKKDSDEVDHLQCWIHATIEGQAQAELYEQAKAITGWINAAAPAPAGGTE